MFFEYGMLNFAIWAWWKKAKLKQIAIKVISLKTLPSSWNGNDGVFLGYLVISWILLQILAHKWHSIVVVAVNLLNRNTGLCEWPTGGNFQLLYRSVVFSLISTPSTQFYWFQLQWSTGQWYTSILKTLYTFQMPDVSGSGVWLPSLSLR